MPTVAQLPPPASQRSHWYAKPVGNTVPGPADAVNWCPTAGLPEIEGKLVFVGAEFVGVASLLRASLCAPSMSSVQAV